MQGNMKYLVGAIVQAVIDEPLAGKTARIPILFVCVQDFILYGFADDYLLLKLLP